MSGEIKNKKEYGCNSFKRKISIGLLTALIVLGAALAPFNIKVDSNSGKIAVTSAIARAQQTVDETSSSSIEKNLSTYASCSIVPGFTGSFAGCVVQAFYYVWYVPTKWLLGQTAAFFNTLAAITLSSSLYNASQFISDAWKIVRDFSNILFIFVLIYVAIAFVLDLTVGGGNPKKVLAWIVIMAILVNFSMFFTKMVIDSTNVLALIFYNKIGQTHQGAHGYSPLTDSSKTGIEERDISGAITAGFQPQQLESSSFFELLKNPPTTTTDFFGNKTVEETVPSTALIVILLISGIIFLYAAYAFFISGISFLGRMVQLWVSIIFSPFAFVSYIVPKFSSLPGLGFTAWSKTLVDAAISAPIFMFFMYLISLLTKVPFINAFTTRDFDGFSNLSTVQVILLVAIPLLIIMKLLLEATAYARKAGGEITNAIFGGLKSVAGVGVAGAAVATGFVGRATIGRLAAGLGESEAIKQKAAQKGFGGTIARFGLKTFETVGKGSLDIRGSQVGKLAGKAATTFQLGELANIDVGKIKGAGGWIAAREEAQKKYEATLARIKTAKTDRELENTWPANVKMRQEYEARKKEYEEEFRKEAQQQRERQGPRFDKAAYRAQYDKEKKDAKEYPEPPKYKTADEINKERTAAYAETLKAGTLYTKAVGFAMPEREAEIAAGKKLAPELSTAELGKINAQLENLAKIEEQTKKDIEKGNELAKKWQEKQTSQQEKMTQRITRMQQKHPGIKMDEEGMNTIANETRGEISMIDIKMEDFKNQYQNAEPGQKKEIESEINLLAKEKAEKEREAKEAESFFKDQQKLEKDISSATSEKDRSEDRLEKTQEKIRETKKKLEGPKKSEDSDKSKK